MLGYIAIYPESAIFYLLLVVICTVLARAAEEFGRPAPLGVAVLLLVAISAIRAPQVGVDTAAYVSAYESETPSYFEPGFALFIELLRPLQATWLYLGLIALVIYGFIFFRLWELRDYCSLSGAVLIFMLLYFPATWNGLRSYLVTAIMFFASRYIFHSKIIRFCITALLCYTVHSTSVVFLLLLLAAPFWAGNLSRNKRTLLTLGTMAAPILAFGVLAAMNASGTLDRYNDTYGDAELPDHVGLSWFLFLVVVVIAVLYFLRTSKNGGFTPEDKTVLLYCALGQVFFLLGFAWFPGGRLSSYFTIYNTLLLSKAWGLSKGERYGFCFRTFLCIYCAYAFFQVLSSNGQALLPYAVG